MAVTYEEWMSDGDALMWNIERDPVLRSTVLSVWILDQSPDLERFEATFDRAVEKIPRLRQRVVADGLGVATPRWEEDPLFDRTYHLRRLRAPGDGDLRDLLDLAAPIAGQAFDKDRPLWEFHLVEGLEGGRAGVIMKIHHAISDGVGMVRMTNSLIERSRDPEPGWDRPRTLAETPDASPRATEMEHLASAVQQRVKTATQRGRKIGEAVGRGLWEAAKDPAGTARKLAETASSVGRLVKPATEPHSPLWTERSFSIHLDALLVSFDALRAAAKAVDGTLNDAFVASIAGGLRLYHEGHGHRVEALRMNMPINIRSGDEGNKAGNQFVPARFDVPVGIEDPKERMRAIRKLVQGQRSEPALPLMEEVSGAINRLGVVAATSFVSGMMKSVDFVTSNVPGPRFPVYTGGARIEQMFPFGPMAGAAVNVTLFSYDGQLQLGINTDCRAVPDPDRLLECIEAGIDEVTAVT
ncbi:MAG: wax ester/triacylglycerol synthase family O-acyltransferase [Deltaproteobacteria bacterium]|nr:wax ester/triacylglycerol synthase family O-acyltransferase [Deltaproteobacteria bacterium]MBW2392708.1 wax ester/triacylglycerol synthase family O-acyltransferase [Deltaproteobacteria bacterium]